MLLTLPDRYKLLKVFADEPKSYTALAPGSISVLNSVVVLTTKVLVVIESTFGSPVMYG